MTEQPAGLRATQQDRTAPWWALGAIVFAGLVMIMIRVSDLLTGLVGVFANEFHVGTRRYLLEFDATSWRVIHLLLGALVLVAGIAVLTGRLWGRVVGIVLVTLGAVANFPFLPYYPFWSLAIITLDVVVIWALVSHGRDVTLSPC
jgi:hypothetical protein